MKWVNFQKCKPSSKFATREPKATLQQGALKVSNPPSLLSVGGCGSLNHAMASLALPATTCRASQASVRQAAGGAGAPQEGHSRMDPAAWAAMVNADGAVPQRLPLARRPRFPTAVPCAMPVCSGFTQGWNVWPIVRERVEERNFPKRSVLAVLSCH